jgi:hypothetical protein
MLELLFPPSGGIIDGGANACGIETLMHEGGSNQREKRIKQKHVSCFLESNCRMKIQNMGDASVNIYIYMCVCVIHACSRKLCWKVKEAKLTASACVHVHVLCLQQK